VSILPELIIQQTLIRGIRLFREHTRFIDMLFRNVDQETLQLIRSFMRDNSIEICLNYPEQDLKVPSIVILLKNEAESQPFIGDLQQGGVDFATLGQPFPADGLEGVQTVVGEGTIGPIAYAFPLLLAPTRAIGGSNNTIVVAAGVINLIDPFEDESWVVVMEGSAAGDKLKIDSILPSLRAGEGATIEVEGLFRAIPDSTTVFKIVGPPDGDGVTGEPSKIFAATDKIERFGTIFKATYQLDIHGPDQETTIYIYNIVKAIFFAANSLMIKQGFLSFIKMAGTDLAPVPDYYPATIYRRSLSFEFEYAFDVFKAIMEPLARHIQVALSVHDPDVGDVDGTEREVSLTTIDI
jgi:hypothetical protein